MGPGTGLGAAQLFWDSGKRAYTVVAGAMGAQQRASIAWVCTTACGCGYPSSAQPYACHSAHRCPAAGEGAHATFAPRGWRQHALSSWVTARLGHCEIEEVSCCAQGTGAPC